MQAVLTNWNKYFRSDSNEVQHFEKKPDTHQFIDRFLSRHLDTLPNGIILDAGCGNGFFPEILAKRYSNLSVIGIDRNDDRIGQANARLSGLKNAKALVASIYHLPFPDNYFDFIYSRFLFEYLHEPVLATTELLRVCKPGATLFLQDLDGQFTLYPEVLPGLADILSTLRNQTGFDTNVGRKLFSFGNAAGFSFLNVATELYHKVSGKTDDFSYDSWKLKLDIVCQCLGRVLGEEKARKLKLDVLKTLKDDNTVLLSTLFTVTFAKPFKQ